MPLREPHPNEEELYQGSVFTNVEACLVLLTLFFKFCLTRECLLFAIANFLPSPNTLPDSTYKFFKLLSHFEGGSGVHCHFFCLNCHHYLDKEITCPNCSHACTKKGSFLQMHLADTLRSFLEDDQIYKFFSSAPNGSEEHELEDIVDGAKYREHPGRSKYDFSLFWNTDGVQGFKSAAKSLWPVHCITPELPPLVRNKFQILTLLWLAEKPTTNTFLKPFCLEVTELAKNGLTWWHPETGKTIVSHIPAPLSSADAVARAMLQGIKQFNGLYGCSFCEHPGVLHELPKKGSVRVYPPGKKYSHACRQAV